MSIAPIVHRAALLLVAAGLVASARAADGNDPGEVRKALQLVAGIGSEYQEAFDEEGRLVRPLDVDEARLLLASVRDVTAHLSVANDPALGNLLDGIAQLLDAQVPPAIVVSYAEVVRRFLIRSTGVHEDVLPPERPSLERGAALFRDNCAGCHGRGGAGDGPDGAQLARKPADFTDVAFMRQETPRDVYNVIMLGRGQAGMPAWGASLTPQHGWDLVAYLWSLARTPAVVEAGRTVWSVRCAGCHGVAGDAVGVRAATLDRPVRSLAGLLDGAAHSDDDVFAAVGSGGSTGAMPAFANVLTTDERWAVVTYLRTLSLEGPSGGGAGALAPDHGAELTAVREILDAALDAHRRGDAAANTLASSAYLRFEPLEKRIADVDETRVELLEASFVAFRNALRDPAAGDADALGRQLRLDLDATAALLRPVDAKTAWGTGSSWVPLGVLLGLGAIAATALAQR